MGIQANRERCRQYVENSIGLVTALNPVLGYEKSAAIAREALDDILKPENMTSPRQLP